MSHFENTNEALPVLGIRKTPEQIAQETEERERREAGAAEFLAAEKKKREKEASIEVDRAVLRAEEITSQQVIEAIMEANPNFSNYDAKRLYTEKVREIVAIERFKEAYFLPKPKFGLRM
jgi:hypothetical protein